MGVLLVNVFMTLIVVIAYIFSLAISAVELDFTDWKSFKRVWIKDRAFHWLNLFLWTAWSLVLICYLWS